MPNVSLTFTQNGGNAIDVTITGVRRNDSAERSSATILAGGETTVRAFLSISEHPQRSRVHRTQILGR